MLTCEIIGNEPYEYLPMGQYIVRALGVCGGRPTFKYSRIEVAGALNRLAAGESLDSIVSGLCSPGGGRHRHATLLEQPSRIDHSLIGPRDDRSG